eukprot:CAMPEP_0113670908 /NCGR_PEP_ID=MMETSP0038_2-20120614/5408_1 /TAXON_ID=2898 /ORGANISM="Cryptomonas paramecium" /LENGTH=255 /DNA_ID=CAMNT_0000586997 /DNA_START=78 /DNA_END=842 /DNA_ORIENTATION=- /assembly_acc=CAM_ASM_000170
MKCQYGTKVQSKDGKSFVMVLRPTAELWTLALPHRTQIIYNVDISTIIFRLELCPGKVVVESGTGSGSLTTSLARAVAPTGRVYTFDFHQLRVEQARTEFKKHRLDEVVVANQADACLDGFKIPPGTLADAVILDLPNPWEAVGNAAAVLKDRGGICTFSPCIEQVQKTCQTLRDQGFTNLSTVEVLLRVWERQHVSVDVPRYDIVDVSGSRALGPHALTRIRNKKRGREEGGGGGGGKEEEEEDDPAAEARQSA